MHKFLRLMKLHKLMDQAGEGGSDASGTGTGDAAALAAAEAAKVAEATAAEAAKTKPTDAEAALLKDVMKQKGRADAAATELAAIKAKLAEFEGIDAAKAKALQAEQEELETKRAIAAGEFDRLTKQMGERHTAETSAVKAQLEAANAAAQTFQKQIADLTVGSSFTSSKFVTEDLTLTASKARVVYGQHFEFKDGKVVGYDKPASASDRTLLVNAAGEALSFEEALKKVVDADPDRDQLLRSKMKAGANSSTVNKGAKKAEGEQTRALSGMDKIQAGLKKLAK